MRHAILHRIEAANEALMLCAPANQNDADLRDQFNAIRTFEKAMQHEDAFDAETAKKDAEQARLIQQLIERGRA